MLAAETVLATMSRAVTIDPTADFSIIDSVRIGAWQVHFAATIGGARALLVPVPFVPAARVRSTRNVIFRTADNVEFAGAGRTWHEPTVIIECRDAKLLASFSAMVAGILGRLTPDAPPSWNDVAALFSEWEKLLARRRLLEEESELGLWGELWCLACSNNSAVLLEGWQGPGGEMVDFQLEALGVEVKTSCRPLVHYTSQAQVEVPFAADDHVFMSLHVRTDLAHGRSLPELVQAIGMQVGDVPEFEEKLAAVGYAREDEDAYRRKYALAQPPTVFPAARIPRVRQADPGVSCLRFRVELDPGDALPATERQRILERMGFPPGEVVSS